MAIVPENWIDNGRMKRIICHWSAGAHKASDLDRSHYHILIEDDGELVRGFHSIAANESAADGTYAAHTRGANTGSIGVAVCCMAGAQDRPFRPGRFPMTEPQWNTMAQVVAELCKAYRIAVSPTTVLGHGEVERNLGKPQKGKWDPLILPWDADMSRRDVGDAFRARVSALLEDDTDVVTPSKVKAKLGGVELAEAVAVNEDSFIKVSELIGALRLRLLDADVNAALFSRDDDDSVITLSHVSMSDKATDFSASDDTVRKNILEDGFVSIRHLAEILNLGVVFDLATGGLEIGETIKPEAEPAPARSVTVKSGDTLSSIAERNLGSANKWTLLRKPDGTVFTEAQARRLKLGQVVVLPDAAPPVAAKPAPAALEAGSVNEDLDDLIGAAESGLHTLARTSIPIIVKECQAQGVTDPAHIAYVLATAEHESKCGKFMRELWGPTAAQRRYEGRRDLGNDQRGDGFRYRGRGYVQVTGRANYRTWTKILDADIVGDPDRVAREPAIAARILVQGMRDGKFRGRSLADCLSGPEPDFFNARDIINGDKRISDPGHNATRGARIAAIADRYLAALTASD